MNRKTRQLYVTDLGQAYYRQCKQILEDLNNLESSISQEGKLVKGVLKINTPIDFGGIYMLPVINAYQQQYPDVKVLMSLDNAAVNLRSAQFDIAIVVTDKLDQGGGRTENSSDFVMYLCIPCLFTKTW